MSMRKYTSARFNFKSLLQYFYTTRDPQDHVTIPHTGQPTYHNMNQQKIDSRYNCTANLTGEKVKYDSYVPYVLTTINVGIREICSLRGIRLLGYKLLRD